MKDDPKLTQYPLTREQKFFAGVWYSMSYAYSLDSHRVRVMHAVNILEELLRLYAYAHASAEDRYMVGRETIAILESESILKRPVFSASTTAVLSLLRKSFGAKYDKSVIEKGRLLLESHLREYVAMLHGRYVDEAIRGVQDAVLSPDARPEIVRFKEIRSLTGSLLSYLIARGQSIEGLFQLYSHVLVPIKRLPATYDFVKHFDLLRRLVTASCRTWQACFAIDGISEPTSFPETIGDISFTPAPMVGMASLPGMKAQGHRLFAAGEADAVDARTAGQLVHERISRVLDIVRFEYDRASIYISDQFASRKNDDEWRLLPIPKVVPNPQSSISRDELDSFAQSVGLLVSSNRFSREGRERVVSAFRLYRMGADTTNFESKLVNWWTGLEFLAKGMSGSSSIASVVEDSVTPILMGVSVINHLNAYRQALLEHSIVLTDVISGQEKSLKNLNYAELYDVLATPAYRLAINSQLRDHPHTQLRFDQFMGYLAAPAEMRSFLERSEQGLRWHLQRVWRARCDIVHSAGRMVNIALLCANLEAYLKSVLRAVLAAFGRIPTLESPQELFLRVEHDYISARDALDRGDCEPLKAFLTGLQSK